MKFVNSVLFRLSKLISKNYSLLEKEELIAGLAQFIASNENSLDRNTLRQLYHNTRLKAYPVFSPEERLRIYGWLKIIELLKNVDGDIVEAGVGYGNSLITFLCGTTHFGSDKKIYAFDSFRGFPIPHHNDLGKKVAVIQQIEGWDDTTPELIERSINFFSDDKLFTLNKNNIIYREGFFKDTMPSGLPDKISLLHIDNDLYEGVAQVLNSAYPRLQNNAVVIFDEYQDPKWPGVKIAVDEFAAIFQLQIRYFPELLRFGFIKNETSAN